MDLGFDVNSESKNYVEIRVLPDTIQEKAVMAAIHATFRTKTEKAANVACEVGAVYQHEYNAYRFVPGAIDMKFLLRIDAEIEKIMETKSTDIQED